MTPITVILIIAIYFSALIFISFLTGKDQSNDAFFKAKKQSPWIVVAFGMIGASLSGVTFISVPGEVGVNQFGYMQAVFGFFFGMLFIVLVLLPLYYRLNVTSIYQYLEQRFGKVSYRTGAFFFFISRMTGSAFRLFLVALTLQYIAFESFGVPFWATVMISILLIWIYTFRSGMKTIVWTDTFQTFFMLLSLFISIYLILKKIDWSVADFINSEEIKSYSKMFYFDDFRPKMYFWKYFLGGMFITITMTGMDQDMMQKNLTCKNSRDSQKNMLTMYSLLIVVNFLFLVLGALLFIYANKFGIQIPVVNGITRTDLLFPEIAMNAGLGTFLSLSFVIGLIAAAYSTADSGLTALTTSFSVDILGIEKKELDKQVPLRKKVHIAMSLVLMVVVLLFNKLEGNVINNLFTFASFTYGPLLGLFTFGIFTKRILKDKYSWIVALISIVLSYGITQIPQSLLGGYQFHWEILPINGFITFVGLWMISEKQLTIDNG